jgi:hypothetical protein
VGSIHTESFRGFRIEELLRQQNSTGHSVESFRTIQCDVQAVDARFLLPVILPQLRGRGARPDHLTELVERFASWDLQTGLECRECALFRLWMKELGDPQWVYARATQKDGEARSAFFDEAARALEAAADRLSRVGGPWLRWGDIHRAVFPATEVSRPFDVPSLEVLGSLLATPGDEHSVSPGSSDFIENGRFAAFSHHSGPSQRMIVELSDPPRVHFVLPESLKQRRDWATCAPLHVLEW